LSANRPIVKADERLKDKDKVEWTFYNPAVIAVSCGPSQGSTEDHSSDISYYALTKLHTDLSKASSPQYQDRKLSYL
jgi:hypothetical protein